MILQSQSLILFISVSVQFCSAFFDGSNFNKLEQCPTISGHKRAVFLDKLQGSWYLIESSMKIRRDCERFKFTKANDDIFDGRFSIERSWRANNLVQTSSVTQNGELIQNQGGRWVINFANKNKEYVWVMDIDYDSHGILIVCEENNTYYTRTVTTYMMLIARGPYIDDQNIKKKLNDFMKQNGLKDSLLSIRQRDICLKY